MFKGFRDFVLRGNAIDMATGIVFGAAFTTVINGFVQSFLTPLVGMALGLTGALTTKHGTIAGAVFSYGQFLSIFISFLLTTAVLYFLVVKPLGRLLPKPHNTDPCTACMTPIPIHATRCPACTTWKDTPRPEGVV